MAPNEFEQFWDARARENPLFYVDNELDYETPDVAAFWERGQQVVDTMLHLSGLELRPDETVVDIGCGVGRLTRVLAGRTAKVYAIDVSGEMLERASALNPQLGNVEWLHGDGVSLRVLGDEAADGCFSHVVFQHIPDPAVTLGYVREMGRVLRPGGWALFQVSTDPSVHAARAGGRRFTRRRRDPASRSDRAWWGSAVGVDDLQRAATSGGLQIERLLGAGSQFTTVLARRASPR